MPRWESVEQDGRIEHTLDGRESAASVTVDPDRRVCVITVGVAVHGIDDATIERCKRRAEELLIDVRKGAVH